MKIKVLNLIIVIIIAFGMFTACSSDKSYGNQLPPGLPSSIPIIEGTIEESRHATFEDGKGYIIGIRTPFSYEDSIEFYKKAFKTSGDTATFNEASNMSGSSQRVMTVETQQQQSLVLMEIISEEDSTYVNIAVHLRK